MVAVDLEVPEGIPHTGVLTSDQGMVTIGGLDLIKVTRGNIRLNNNVGLYREAGKRTGTTFAGVIRVTGQITQALLNWATVRLMIGAEPGTHAIIADETIDKPESPVFHGPGIITRDQIQAIMGIDMAVRSFPINPSANLNFYPWRVDIALELNINKLASIPATAPETEDTPSQESGIQMLICKSAMLSNHVIAFDANGIITSGPLNFIGSASRWSRTV